MELPWSDFEWSQNAYSGPGVISLVVHSRNILTPLMLNTASISDIPQWGVFTIRWMAVFNVDLKS